MREGIEGNLCRCTGYQNIVRRSRPRSRPRRRPRAPATAEVRDDRRRRDPVDRRARVGKARRRKEDARLITGRTRWTDNIQLPGMLHLAMVRSPFAHARITSDRHVGGEAGRPASSACWTGPELAGSRRPALRLADHRGHEVADAPADRAVGRVAFAGEIVAVRRRAVGRRGAGRRRTSSTSSTRSCPSSSTWRPRSPRAPRSPTPSSARTRTPPGCSTPAAAGTGERRRGAIAAARTTRTAS